MEGDVIAPLGDCRSQSKAVLSKHDFEYEIREKRYEGDETIEVSGDTVVVLAVAESEGFWPLRLPSLDGAIMARYMILTT